MLDLGNQEAVLTMEGRPILSLPIIREGTLTADRAAELAAHRAPHAIRGPLALAGMIYRHDLIDHFSWLARSKYFDEAIDEALIAIAFAAAGHEWDWVNTGAAWMTAGGFVEKFELESFVERAVAERII